MKKPYVVCHMASTLDGRIITEHWGKKEQRKQFSAVYEKCHNSFGADAWMAGRITLEKDFTKALKPQLPRTAQPVDRKPFLADKEATTFAIAADARGKLGWNDNEIEGDHIIEILTEKVSDKYLQYLRQKGVSYIFAGKEELNFKTALQQLAKLFPIQRLMLEGGGTLNGSLLNAGLIDEISLLILPITDGTLNTASVFDVADYLTRKPAPALQLKEVQKMEHDIVWLQYKVKEK